MTASGKPQTVREKPSPENHDRRFDRLRELGEAERTMTAALSKAHAEIADLVAQLTPPHAPIHQIESVVKASGYSRTLIDALRAKNHPWHRT
jgi:hypothetical protein